MSDDLAKRYDVYHMYDSVDIEESHDGQFVYYSAHQARIEQLEREKAELSASLDENWVTHQEVLFSKRYAAKAEAKLAKAVEALREIVSNQGYMDDPWGHALATLADLGELEGKE